MSPAIVEKPVERLVVVCSEELNIVRLPLLERMRVGWRLSTLLIKEYLANDSIMCRWLVGWLGYFSAVILGLLGKSELRFLLLCRLHRANLIGAADQLAEHTAYLAAHSDARLGLVLSTFLSNPPRTKATNHFFEEPSRLLGPAAIVLKSAEGREKGVLYAHYNHTLPLLARFYDLGQILERYYLAIEPSWSGYCDLSVLSCYSIKHPVFVAASEPRDARLLHKLGGNLVTMGVGNNWWVDHRIFKPTGIVKDIDVAMIAGWGSYKRHYRFFEVLSRLKRRGVKLKVLLIGYSVGWSKEEILKHAHYYGIADQLNIYEDVPYEQVNALVNRAKVHVLWSRKEGFPRATIESMFAGLPNIIRTKFNYGHRYAYINEQTGCFADDETLPTALLRLIDRSHDMDPRTWVMQNMSCHRAADIVSARIGEWCAENSHPWTSRIATKVTRLHSMHYWDENDRDRFASDYDWIAKQCQRTIPQTCSN